MGEIELVELSAMIIGIIAFMNFPFVIKRRRDFIKYLPGILFMVLGFVFENIEEVFLHDLFAILENISILLGAILLSMAVLMELDRGILKNRNSQSTQKEKNKK